MSRWPRIGTDESGKGDYFGYLVVAGALVKDEGIEQQLAEAGVKDSKRLSDKRIQTLADIIRETCPHEIVRISPAKYNDLYPKFGNNLNRLLAWAHAKVVENLLQRFQCDLVVSDQFGDERFLLTALQDRGQKVHLEQRPRAESDLAVAAGSILARATFVQTLHKLSKGVGMELPKGATHVIEPGRRLVAERGEATLRDVAKVHFKSTKKILQTQS